VTPYCQSSFWFFLFWLPDSYRSVSTIVHVHSFFQLICLCTKVRLVIATRERKKERLSDSSTSRCIYFLLHKNTEIIQRHTRKQCLWFATFPYSYHYNIMIVVVIIGRDRSPRNNRQARHTQAFCPILFFPALLAQPPAF